MPKTIRHAVLGAGGVGGLIGACLAHSGDSVTLVVRPETVSQYPSVLRLESAFGNFEAAVSVAAQVPPTDVLWITVKATQLEPALTAIAHPASVGAIVPLLNGIDHIPLLRTQYGNDRVIPATIAVETERVSPGRILHRSPFARLNVSSTGRDRLSSTVDKFQHIGFECRFVDDEPTLMWGKLVFLAPIALSTTAAAASIGAVLADPSRRSQWEACVRETCAVGAAEGAKVEPEPVLAWTQALPPTVRSSMQKDVEHQRIPELDAIAGPVIRGAGRHNLQIPATSALAAEVQAKVGQFGRTLS
jgi:2-dehydropantoate 2-reductase